MQVGERVDGEDRNVRGEEHHVLNETRKEVPRVGVKDRGNDVDSVSRAQRDHNVLRARRRVSSISPPHPSSRSKHRATHPKAALVEQRGDVSPSGRCMWNGEPDRPACAVERYSEEDGEACHDRDVPMTVGRQRELLSIKRFVLTTTLIQQACCRELQVGRSEGQRSATSTQRRRQQHKTHHKQS